MSLTAEQQTKLGRAQQIVGRTFENTQSLLSAITHPSATEGRAVKFSYERLEFLGDSILGALVANAAFHQFPELDEGGLTRIKVALVSGASLSEVAEKLGFADVIVFGSSETGTGRRGLHSALGNGYEAAGGGASPGGGPAGAAATAPPTPISPSARARSFPRWRKSAWAPSGSLPSSAPALRSPCGIWKFAAREISWARSSPAI